MTDPGSKTPIDLLVFDFDGTLVDTKHDIAFSVNLVLDELGLPQLPETTIFGYVGKGVLNLMTRSLEATCPSTPKPEIEVAVTAFMKHYEEHLMDRTVFFPNCREMLDHYADKKKAVLSNKPERFIRIILEELGSLNHFDAIGGGDTYDKKKPDPVGLLHMMKELDVALERTLMIGDSQVDIDTARAAGVKTCGVTYGHATVEEMEALKPDWMVSELEELREIFI